MSSNSKQRIQLATLLGITAETHPHLATSFHHGPVIVADNLLCPLGPDADLVWLAPLMKWMHPRVAAMAFTEFAGKIGAKIATGGGWWHEGFGPSNSAGLLRAAVIAGLPEIVAIFGELKSEVAE